MKKMPGHPAVTAWARLLKIQTQLLEAVATALKSADLPPLAWYDVLLELKRVESMRPYELSQAVLLPKYNLSRLLDRLEREGLILREDCTEDGRGQMIRITPAGRRLLKRMWPVYGDVIRKRFEERLSETEIEALALTLGKLR